MRRVLPPLLLVLASCSPPGRAVEVPRLVLPDAVVVERAPFDRVTVREVTLTNAGTADARVTLAVDAPFRVTGAPVVVPAGASETLSLTFRPTSYTDAHVELVASAPGHTLRVPVVGTVDSDLDDDGFTARGAGGDDCDDDDPGVHPGAPERCDGVDRDCNGLVDDDPVDPQFWYADADDDGFGGADTRWACARPSGFTDVPGDCDDTDPRAYPGAPEVWYDGVDQDCDGGSDFDRDGDGFDNLGSGGTDCVDTDPRVHPGADDPPYDGIDQDCDGWSDDDADRDGHDAVWRGGDDCDDDDPLVNPHRPETYDGVDEDCDGFVDEDFTLRGHVVVSELLVHPLAGPDDQYVELHNRSHRTVDLTNARIETGGGSTTLPTLRVPAGGYALLCADPDASPLPCDAPLPAPLTDVDAVRVDLHVPLDEVDWSTWDLPDGASLEPTPGNVHPDRNDAFDRWCVAADASPTGDRGSPGAAGSCAPD